MYVKACKILGVRIGAGQKEIKDAYRRLAVLYHPDTSQNPKTASRFIEITRAYKYLSDPGAYHRYISRYQAVKKKKRHHDVKVSSYAESMAYRRWKEENLPDLPPALAKLAHFINSYYEYTFLAISVFIIILPPVVFYFDDKLSIEENGWSPIIGPVITGILLFTGTFSYMLRNRNPFALRIQKWFIKKFKTRNG